VSCRAPPALNIARYCNQDVDRELDAARAVAEPTERLAHYRGVAEHTLEDLPIIYLYHNKWLWAFSSKLEGFAPLPDGLIRPQGLRLD
jgi:peptide/nickel transport system substrate-binding protein